MLLWANVIQNPNHYKILERSNCIYFAPILLTAMVFFFCYFPKFRSLFMYENTNHIYLKHSLGIIIPREEERFLKKQTALFDWFLVHQLPIKLPLRSKLQLAQMDMPLSISQTRNQTATFSSHHSNHRYLERKILGLKRFQLLSSTAV